MERYSSLITRLSLDTTGVSSGGMAALRMFSDLERSAYRLDRLIGGMHWKIDSGGLMKGVRDASGAVRDAEVALKSAEKAVASFGTTSQSAMDAFERKSFAAFTSMEQSSARALSGLDTAVATTMARLARVDLTMSTAGIEAGGREMLSVLSALEHQGGLVGDTMRGLNLSADIQPLLSNLSTAQGEFAALEKQMAQQVTLRNSMDRARERMEFGRSPTNMPTSQSYGYTLMAQSRANAEIARLQAEMDTMSPAIARHEMGLYNALSGVGGTVSGNLGQVRTDLLSGQAAQMDALQASALDGANALSAVQQKQTEHLAEQLAIQQKAVSTAKDLQLAEEKTLRNRLLGAGVGTVASLGLMALGGMGLRALGTDVNAARNLQDVTASMTIAASKGRTTPEQLSLQAMQIASRTQFSQVDVMKMMEVAATTGIMSRDVLANIMPTIANVAEIAYRTKGTPFEQTAEAAVSVAHQFVEYGAKPGMSPSEAAAANKRFESLMGNLGQLLMVTPLAPNQLRNQMAYVAGLGGSYGMTPTDVMSFVAFGSNLGMTTGQGGAGRMRAFLTGLLPALSTGQNIGNLVRSGLQEAGGGEFFPGGKPAPDMVRNALEIILRARQKLSPEMFMAAMGTAFGRAGAAVGADMSNPAAIGRLDELTQFMRQDPIGWANRQQEKLNQTLIGQQRTFETNLNNLHAVIGMNLLGPLTDAVSLFARLTEGAAEFLAMHPRFAALATQLIAVGSVMSIVTGAILGLRVIGGLIGGWGPALAGIRSVITVIPLLGEALAGGDLALGLGLLLAALGPAGWVILGAGALTLLALNFDKVSGAVGAVADGLGRLGRGIADIAGGAARGFFDWLGQRLHDIALTLGLITGESVKGTASSSVPTHIPTHGGQVPYDPGAGIPGAPPTFSPTNPHYRSGQHPDMTVPHYTDPRQQRGLGGEMHGHPLPPPARGHSKVSEGIHVHVDARGSTDPASVEAAARRGVAHGAAALHQAVAQHNLFGTVLPGDVDPSMRAVPV